MNKRKEMLMREKMRNDLPLDISSLELSQLQTNIPIQKIIGFVEMQNVRIELQEKVLIPRYETEEVVIQSYAFINEKSKVLDLCTGSGFIGLAIKKNTNAKVVMTDIDLNAIKQAKHNANINNLDVEIIHSDLFENINEKNFDLIISNPPYIPLENVLSDAVLEHEPHHALFAKEQGNYFYRKILEQAFDYLKPSGVIVFEISPDNLIFFKENFSNVEIIKDINNKERIAILKKYS